MARPDDAVMSIVARRGRVVAEPRSRLLRFERPSTAGAAAGTIGSQIGPDDPRRDLARLALDLVLRTSEPLRLPERWTRTPFGREVDRTRAPARPDRDANRARGLVLAGGVGRGHPDRRR